MIVQRAYKTEIKPNSEQLTMLLRHCGATRWAYNWGLARKIRYYKLFGKTVSGKTLDTHLRKLKQRLPELAWLSEISSHTRQQAFINLDAAYKAFFARVKKGAGGAAGFPKFKSRAKGLGSATFYSYRIERQHVNLSNVGRVKLAESDYLPVGKYGNNAGLIMRGLRVTERAGRWYASVQVELTMPDVDASDKPVVGVDVGIKTLATVSDGTTHENPKALARYMRRLKRQQRQVSRRTKGSANRKKAVARLAKLHARIANIRGDVTHKATTAIAKNASVIGVESLNVSGMMKNGRLARAVADANMSEFLRQVKYKAEWNGARVVEAGQWMPSSKTCSVCGCVKKELTLSERTFVCDDCGSQMDRDLNAARNLAKFAGSYSENQNACGGESSDATQVAAVLPDESGIPALGGELDG